MGSCILQVLGEQMNPEEVISATRLPVYKVFVKGTPVRGGSRTYETSGFCCDTNSTADTLELLAADAIRFLRQHETGLVQLSRDKSVESAFVDFAFPIRMNETTVVVQREFLSAEFVELAGRLKMGLCLTLFPPEEETSGEEG